MLSRLSIRNVVLIEKLDLDFASGLGVLTGETGAGKSILLDSLNLAMGSRAEARLVRHGADQASVTAEFSIPLDHTVYGVLNEHGLDVGGEPLLLRRQLGVDGRSRAYINDQSVSVSLLREIGNELVEIHGQFDNQRLLNSATHLDILDAHGGHGRMLSDVKAAHHTWRETVIARKRAEDALETARLDEEFLRHAVAELKELNPQSGEEESLAEERQMLMHGEKLLEAMNTASKSLDNGKGVERLLRDAIRSLEPVVEKADGLLDPVMKALDQASEHVALGAQELETAANRVDLDPRHLEQVEERLFALRALARKHNVDITALSDLYAKLCDQLNSIDHGGEQLDKLARAEQQARGNYGALAAKLSQARKQAALKLDQAVSTELVPLRMGAAEFKTNVLALLEEEQWGTKGWDRIAFEVATNPGAPAGPLNKIASGGELSRFMLALKVVLAKSDPVPTLVFDEVDSGIGGQVADAVGQRLATLGQDVQVLVVTHSPQVAARGKTHLHISKSETDGRVRTTVVKLDQQQRGDELARMLAGENITSEARAAALSLLHGAAE